MQAFPMPWRKDRMCCNFQGWLAGDVKESRNGNPSGDLQMAADRTGLILCAVRWYLRYSLLVRDVEELLRSVVSMSVTQRSGAGRNITALSWSSDCDRISSQQTSRGGWTKPTSA